MTLALFFTSAAPRLCAAVSPFVLFASSVCAESGVQVLEMNRVREALESFQTRMQNMPTAEQKDLAVTIAVSLSLNPDYLKNLSHSCAKLRQGKTTCRLAVQGVPIEIPIEKIKASNEQSQKEMIEKALVDFSDKGIRTLVQEGFKKLSQATAPVGVEIDPMLFKEYAITSVPTFVFEHFENGKHITTGVMTGAVTLDVALDSAMEMFETYRKDKRQ